MIYLASKSPRRRELLAQIGIEPTVVPVDVDETPSPGEMPLGYVRRIAQTKARAGYAALPGHGLTGGPTLGADTAVVLGSRILGKPATRDEAASMLSDLSNTTHDVLSAVCVVDEAGERTLVSESRVTMVAIEPATIRAFVAREEVLDKAGGYAIQGLAAQFISRIEGSYSGIVGLPLYETAELLSAVGIPILKP